MPTTVFISSTYGDLLKHRATVATTLLKAGFDVVDMVNFMAQSEDAVSACLNEVAASDLFVGIYAWRYGFIPEEAEVSIIEQEFIEAQKLDKVCFCFMVEEDYPWPEEDKEKGIMARLQRDFKARLGAMLGCTAFTTADNLAEKVLTSLQQWEQEHNPTEAKSESQAAAGGTTFNMGDVKAAVVTQGGSNTFGDLNFGNLDFSETTSNVSEGGVLAQQGSTVLQGGSTLVQGDQYSGHFEGDVNIGSQLFTVRQDVEEIPNASESEKEMLIDLINQLQQALEQVPQDKEAEADRAVKRVDDLVQELKEKEPDKDTIKKTGNRLKSAASGLAVAMPQVLTISTKIVSLAFLVTG